jgi:HSP20 family protein
MTMTFLNHEKELFRMNRDIDQFFGQFRQNAKQAAYRPVVDIEENEEGFVLHADLPGLAENEISIEVDGQELVISGTREVSKTSKEGASYRRERRLGDFERRFKMGPNIQSENIEASYRNGVLSVTLPRSEEDKPRKIEVQLH